MFRFVPDSQRGYVLFGVVESRRKQALFNIWDCEDDVITHLRMGMTGKKSMLAKYDFITAALADGSLSKAAAYGNAAAACDKAGFLEAAAYCWRVKAGLMSEGGRRAAMNLANSCERRLRDLARKADQVPIFQGA